MRQGDYNGDGIVDIEDYVIWSDNFEDPIDATFYDGDGNGNGVVDNDEEGGDYELWQANFGQTGNRDSSCDFDRDGCVGFSDVAIFSEFYQNLPECASRFEGDATGDGAVTSADLLELSDQFSEGCDGEGFMAGGDGDATLEALFGKMAKDDDALAQVRETWRKGVETADRNAVIYLAPIAKSLIPEDPDVNNDGKVDNADFKIIDAALGVKR